MLSARCRMSLLAVVATATVVVADAPAFAHSEFQPDSAPAGKVTTVKLFAENEKSDEGTVKVQLHFPEDQPITLAALPRAPGWTTKVDGGKIGGPVSDVIWSRQTAKPENVLLPISLGPVPDRAARVQFKVLQTYSGGDVDRWIQAARRHSRTRHARPAVPRHRQLNRRPPETTRRRPRPARLRRPQSRTAAHRSRD